MRSFPHRVADANAKLRLFCFPFAGGSAQAFRNWKLRGVEVCAFEPPGRGTRFGEPAFDRIGDLTEHAMASVLPLLDKPFAVLGYSLGGKVMLELARALRRQRARAPVHLFAAASSSPRASARRKVRWDLPDRELADELDRMGGTPREVLDAPELMEIVLPTVRADFRIADTYVCTEDAPLDVPITSLTGIQDPDVTPASAREWAEQTTGKFRLVEFDGGHFFLSTDRDALLREIMTDLAEHV